MRRTLLLPALILSLASCHEPDATTDGGRSPAGGKADDFADARQWEVYLTDPHCDVCTPADKAVLLEESKIIARIIELIETADETVEVAQFTFSNRDIEAALVRAHESGKRVRLAMNHAQAQGDTVAKRLSDRGLEVEFVEGKNNGSFSGLQHAKFMLVDGDTLLMGSNNWSSTGLSINNENTMVVQSATDDPLLLAFGCYFDAMVAGRIDDGPGCSTEEVTFSPSSAATKVLRDRFRAADASIDVLMHHLLFDKSLKELTKAAVAGKQVRVLVNAADRDETQSSLWDALRAAGAEIRYKKTNPDAFQIMHHKLAIVDGDELLVGSGNWSGSAFFNNYEFYLRNTNPEVVEPFVGNFERLWAWSLDADALDRGLTAAQQDVERTEVFFGNLHAHHNATDGARLLDDGKLTRSVAGETVDVSEEFDHGDGARFAYEYARDQGGLDFMALSPHTLEESDDAPADVPNMTESGYARMLATAGAVNEESAGMFVALGGMEWSSNSTGNHVNILGTEALCKAQRGAFDQLYGEFLPGRRDLGEQPVVMFNHPRTFRRHTETLDGSWDQVFDVNLSEIPKAGQRKQKFNDYGIDDFEPLAGVRQSWIEGAALPDRGVVDESARALANASAPYARLMEVTLGRGTEFTSEEARNPSLSENEAGELERFTKVDDWTYYLSRGFRLSPVASHDNHQANWGTGHTSRTAVIAPRLEAGSLLDALRGGSVYASEDENLELRLYAGGRVRAGGGLTIVDGKLPLDLLLEDPDVTERFSVRVFAGTVGRDGTEVVFEGEVVPSEWTSLEVEIPGVGEHFVFVEVHQAEADRMAWSAPIWVHRTR